MAVNEDWFEFGSYGTLPYVDKTCAQKKSQARIGILDCANAVHRQHPTIPSTVSDAPDSGPVGQTS